MLVLVTYDVNTQDKAGRGRLSKVAKECTKYGQRVQDSVFECDIDSEQYVRLKAKLLSIMNKEVDSIRFYNLGNHFDHKVEHYGKQNAFDAESVLIL